MNETTSKASISTRATSITWSPWARGVASALIVYHLGAILTGPLSIPETITGIYLRQIYLPYTSAAFLDHGYKFFAPDPGPSHVVRYELEMPDGELREGVFPDREGHWPRLLYHRYFMLSEQINDGRADEVFEEVEVPDEFRAAERRQLVFVESFAKQLLRETGAAKVTLHYRRHLIPPPQEIDGGGKLDEPRWYRQRKLGTWMGDAAQ